ncbi:hypothetical protein MVEN_02411900 [Mycena venus]|uniref:Uncharacterized protein n=1 Tax=Mycena venus TaxID=2733690 RepID=A0A8H6X2D7_9AGAR|nr:hypothetical protein MVEN_02411900 [Mycena venus]
MRAFAILSGLAALSSAVAAPLTGCTSELFCDSSATLNARSGGVCLAELCVDASQAGAAPLKRDAPTVPSKASVYADLTNSERLARGLPLKPPARRTKAARDGAASPVPSYTAKGHLLVRDAGDNSVIGYASKTVSTATLITPDLVNALTVSITLPVGATSGSQLNLAQVDSPNAFTSFGLVQGRDSTTTDISTGSFNYLYISSTNDTAAGSSPQQPGNMPSNSLGTTRSSESAVWTIDMVSGTVFPTWINSGGVAATTQLFTQSNALYAGGDADAFGARYPSPVTLITLTWVPAV